MQGLEMHMYLLNIVLNAISKLGSFSCCCCRDLNSIVYIAPIHDVHYLAQQGLHGMA